MASSLSKVEQARAAMASSSLSVTAPGSKATPLLSTSTVLTLRVAEIEPYDKNPRTDRNECYDDIKESIRIAGLDSILQVTRLPGQDRYTIAKGGNTRLAILKELFAETNDPRFETVACQLIPWVSHSAAISEHVKENTLRGSMSYFDKAKAYLDIRTEIGNETGKQPGVRELGKVLHESYGLSVDHASLGRYLHVAEHFQAIKPWTNNITCKALIPAYNNLLRLGIRFEKSEADLHLELHAALERYASTAAAQESFDVESCINAMDTGICAFLQLTEHQLRFALSALQVSPSAPMAELLTTPAPMTTVATTYVAGNAEPGAPAEENAATDGLEDTRSAARTGAKPLNQVASELGSQSSLQQNVATSPAANAATPAADTDTNNTAAHTSSAAAQASSPKRSLTVEGALDQLIDAATKFTDLCGVGEACRTSLSLPVGFYMDIPDEPLTQPSSSCPDSRIRVAGWWMAAAVAKQFDEEESRLLPSGSMWRKFWVQTERESAGEVDATSLFSVIQEHMGAVLGDDGRIALALEYSSAVLGDVRRAQAYGELVASMNQLCALRNKGA
jgi:ParB family protein of integrating conjugative element (PFGI_1 class)